MSHSVARFLAALLLTTPLFAATINVPAGDGPALVAAMTTAATNMDATNTVNLGGGTYLLTAVDNTNDGPSGLASVSAAKTLVINGAGSTIERSTAPGTPDFRIFHLDGVTGTTLTLNDLTLRNGLVPATQTGGAIRASGTGGSTTTFLNMNRCTVTGCDGGDRGGAIAMLRCTATIAECTFSGNQVDLEGGAIWSRHFGLVTITDSTISGNMVTNGGAGGGIHRGSNGFGIETQTILRRCTIEGNMVLGGSGNGGGIFHECFVSTSTRIIEVELCTISGNHADGDGGGIANFARDVCCSGFEAISEMNLTSCTVTGNTAGGRGGGFHNSDSGGVTTSRIRLSNTIVAGNMATVGDADGHGGSMQFTQGHNLIGDNSSLAATFPAGLPTASMDWVGSSGTPLDPQLDVLAANGGPTMTHALLPTSPARDNGDPSLTGTDQRGEMRPQGTGVDIGAYEATPGPTCTLMSPTMTVMGDAVLTIDAISPSAPTVTATFEFSTDTGVTFAPCTAAATSPLANPIAPGAVDFYWDTLVDAIGTTALTVGVLVRATVDDGVVPTTGECTATPFDVDNTASCASVCGDCDQGGTGPDVIDALVAAQISAGLITPTMPQMNCCDVNASSSVDVIDALVMAQGAAGLPVMPACP